MRRELIRWMGLVGVLALVSYTAAVVFSPTVYPGYDWMAQAVSDLSAESAPSRRLWKQLAALYDVGSVVCATCLAIYASDRKVSTRLFRIGVYLFACMTWVSNVGYAAFPLPDGGKEIASFQETMHIVVTVLVVVLSVASLVCLIVNGYRDRRTKGLGICAAIALAMMLVGAVGQGIVDPRYFGVVERFSVFSAVGFNAVLGINLFCGFKGMGGIEHG